MSVLGLVAILVLLLANAYCVAAEFALVVVRRSQVQIWISEGRSGAQSVARALDRLDDSFAATQLGITLSSIGLGFLGEPALARGFEAPLRALGFGSVGVHGVAVAISFAIVTFLHVVLGELMPRAIGLNRAPAVALACAPSLVWIARIFRPAIAVLNGTGNFALRALGVPPARHGANTHSATELAALVREAGDAGELRSDAVQMLGNVFRISDKCVADVMVARDQVKAISRDIAMEPLLDIIREEGFTRFPVYQGTLDHVVGVLHSKDVFYLHSLAQLVILEDALRPHLEIAPDVSLSDALRLFRRERRHLAVVRGPDGVMQGIITLEDVLVQIIGTIEEDHGAEEWRD